MCYTTPCVDTVQGRTGHTGFGETEEYMQSPWEGLTCLYSPVGCPGTPQATYPTACFPNREVLTPLYTKCTQSWHGANTGSQVI